MGEDAAVCAICSGTADGRCIRCGETFCSKHVPAAEVERCTTCEEKWAGERVAINGLAALFGFGRSLGPIIVYALVAANSPDWTSQGLLLAAAISATGLAVVVGTRALVLKRRRWHYLSETPQELPEARVVDGKRITEAPRSERDWRRSPLFVGTLAAWTMLVALIAAGPDRVLPKSVIAAMRQCRGEIPCRMKNGHVWMFAPSEAPQWRYSKHMLGPDQGVIEGSVPRASLSCDPTLIYWSDLEALRNHDRELEFREWKPYADVVSLKLVDGGRGEFSYSYRYLNGSIRDLRCERCCNWRIVMFMIDAGVAVAAFFLTLFLVARRIRTRIGSLG